MTLRLKKIVAAIPPCKVLADVGCDHGYIGLEALRSGVEKVIFIDISQPSLQKAMDNCGDFQGRAEFLCRDGIGDVVADCAVIAGMGGLEIISVLKGAKVLPQTLVLQPMRNVYDVRKFLTEQYEIARDEKFADGKFYDLIVAKYNGAGCNLSEMQLQFGLTNLACPSEDFRRFLAKEQKKYSDIYNLCGNQEVLAKLKLIQSVQNSI